MLPEMQFLPETEARIPVPVHLLLSDRHCCDRDLPIVQKKGEAMMGRVLFLEYRINHQNAPRQTVRLRMETIPRRYIQAYCILAGSK